jgi:hypothetical protein
VIGSERDDDQRSAHNSRMPSSSDVDTVTRPDCRRAAAARAASTACMRPWRPAAWSRPIGSQATWWLLRARPRAVPHGRAGRRCHPVGPARSDVDVGHSLCRRPGTSLERASRSGESAEPGSRLAAPFRVNRAP